MQHARPQLDLRVGVRAERRVGVAYRLLAAQHGDALAAQRPLVVPDRGAVLRGATALPGDDGRPQRVLLSPVVVQRQQLLQQRDSYLIPRRDGQRAAEARSFTAGTMLLLGLGTWLFEFATAVPYFAAIGLMTSAGLAAAEWLPLLGAYVVIMVLPGILP